MRSSGGRTGANGKLLLLGLAGSGGEMGKEVNENLVLLGQQDWATRKANDDVIWHLEVNAQLCP